MNFINQNTIKIVANIILLFPIVIIDILIYFKYKDRFFQKQFFILFCLINFTIIQYVLDTTTHFPYSDYLEFKSDEEIFQYNFPKMKVNKKYKYENDAFYIYENGEESNFVHFVKSNDEWNWCNEELPRPFNSCSVSAHSIKASNNARIFIRCHTKEDSKFSITDSNSSKFERFSHKLTEWTRGTEYDIIYTALLDDYPSENYEITIDNKVYKFFK